MAKTIKRVGIIFFVLVVSLLVAVGSVFAVNLTSNDFYANANEIATDYENEDTNEYSEAEKADILKHGVTYILQGDSYEMENQWNSIIQESVENNVTIRVILGQDWIARDDEACNTTFGSGIGFGGNMDDDDYNYATICVPSRAKIILDLNGKTISRNLTEATTNGRTIWVIGKLDLYDSSYSSKEAYETLENAPTKLRDLECGKIIGAYTGRHNPSLGTNVHMNGAGIRVSGTMNIFGGMICDNIAESTGGGLASYGPNAVVNFYDGVIVDNSVMNPRTTSYGGGVLASEGGTFNMYGGIIYNNSANVGGAMDADRDSKVNLYNGYIVGNQSYSLANIYIAANARFSICGGVKVCDNRMGESGYADVYLRADQKIYIDGLLTANGNAAKIGVVLATDYPADTPFTLGYKFKGNTLSPSTFFFANDSSLQTILQGDEVAFSTEGESASQEIVWSYTDESTGIEKTTTNSNIVVNYTGQNYTIKASIGQFFDSAGRLVSEKKIINAGSTFAFSKDESYSNKIFTLTILPKEVDIVWSDTNLVYNGTDLVPTATVKAGDLADGDSCNVNVDGEQTMAGNYIASVISLSNSNYKVKTTSKSNINYTISKANMTIDLATNNISKDYTGNSVDCGNSWFNYSTNGLLGQDIGKSLDSLFDIDLKAFVPTFNGQNSAVNVGEYAIGVKELDASHVFTGNGNYNVTINYVNGGKLTITPSNVVRASVESGYDYLVLDNDRRVAYKDRGMIHGENDSNVNVAVNVANGNAQYVIGNIMPETSVQTLLNGLVYNQEIGALVVYNKQGGIVADDNAVVGTGWYIEYANERIYLSVLGDVTGDGRIDATDITYLRRVANGEVSDLSLAVQLAAMVDNRGKITSVDAEILRAVCKYEITIDMYF